MRSSIRLLIASAGLAGVILAGAQIPAAAQRAWTDDRRDVRRDVAAERQQVRRLEEQVRRDEARVRDLRREHEHAVHARLFEEARAIRVRIDRAERDLREDRIRLEDARRDRHEDHRGPDHTRDWHDR